jgi:hypothetical protein
MDQIWSTDPKDVGGTLEFVRNLDLLADSLWSDVVQFGALRVRLLTIVSSERWLTQVVDSCCHESELDILIAVGSNLLERKFELLQS